VSAIKAAFICQRDAISSQRAAKTVDQQPDGSKVFYIKSHHNYGTENYHGQHDCYATFKAPARKFTQGLMIEVLEGHISEQSYFAFWTKSGSEKFTNIKSPAIRRELHVPPGHEDKRLLTLHFHAGGGQDRGFLIKLTVSPPG